jgi:hypothetical protein
MNVDILCFDEMKWVSIENPQGRLFRTLQVPEALFKTDYFINLPKLKTHMLTRVSLCIKNLLGLIHDDNRMVYHRNDISEKIVDLLHVKWPDLNIIDGLWAMEGQAPFHGKAIPDFNVLIAGTDAIAVDTVTAELMGFQKMEVPHIVLARKRFGRNKYAEIELLGDDPEHIRYRFERPVLSSAGWFNRIHCIECGVCNGCLSAIRHSLDKLAFEKKLEQIQEVTIVSGMPMPNKNTLESWNGRLILFGNCSTGFQFYSYEKRAQALWIPGCPPHVLDLEKTLIDLKN